MTVLSHLLLPLRPIPSFRPLFHQSVAKEVPSFALQERDKIRDSLGATNMLASKLLIN